MGRPKEFDSDTVLLAATDCFWGDGIARTSISSLVEAMKIQRSSFYNSFSSRDGILAIALERYLDSSPLSKLIYARERDDSSEPDFVLIDLILDFSHFLAEKGAGRGCLFFNGLSELRPSDEQAYELYQDANTRITGGLSFLLERIAYSSSDQDASQINIDHVLCILIGLSHFSKLDANEYRLAKIGLEQLAGLSPHFARRINEHAKLSSGSHQSVIERKMSA